MSGGGGAARGVLLHPTARDSYLPRGALAHRQRPSLTMPVRTVARFALHAPAVTRGGLLTIAPSALVECCVAER